MRQDQHLILAGGEFVRHEDLVGDELVLQVQVLQDAVPRAPRAPLTPVGGVARGRAGAARGAALIAVGKDRCVRVEHGDAVVLGLVLAQQVAQPFADDARVVEHGLHRRRRIQVRRLQPHPRADSGPHPVPVAVVVVDDVPPVVPAEAGGIPVVAHPGTAHEIARRDRAEELLADPGVRHPHVQLAADQLRVAAELADRPAALEADARPRVVAEPAHPVAVLLRHLDEIPAGEIVAVVQPREVHRTGCRRRRGFRGRLERDLVERLERALPGPVQRGDVVVGLLQVSAEGPFGFGPAAHAGEGALVAQRIGKHPGAARGQHVLGKPPAVFRIGPLLGIPAMHLSARPRHVTHPERGGEQRGRGVVQDRGHAHVRQLFEGVRPERLVARPVPEHEVVQAVAAVGDAHVPVGGGDFFIALDQCRLDAQQRRHPRLGLERERLLAGGGQFLADNLPAAPVQQAHAHLQARHVARGHDLALDVFARLDIRRVDAPPFGRLLPVAQLLAGLRPNGQRLAGDQIERRDLRRGHDLDREGGPAFGEVGQAFLPDLVGQEWPTYLRRCPRSSEDSSRIPRERLQMIRPRAALRHVERRLPVCPVALRLAQLDDLPVPAPQAQRHDGPPRRRAFPCHRHGPGGQFPAIQTGLTRELYLHLRLALRRPQHRARQLLLPVVVFDLPAHAVGDLRPGGHPDNPPLPERHRLKRTRAGQARRQVGRGLRLGEQLAVVRANQHHAGAGPHGRQEIRLGVQRWRRVVLLRQTGRRQVLEEEHIVRPGHQHLDPPRADVAAEPLFLVEAVPVRHVQLDIQPLHQLGRLPRVGMHAFRPRPNEVVPAQRPLRIGPRPRRVRRHEVRLHRAVTLDLVR